MAALLALLIASELAQQQCRTGDEVGSWKGHSAGLRNFLDLLARSVMKEFIVAAGICDCTLLLSGNANSMVLLLQDR